MRALTFYSPRQFTLLRVLLGLYFAGSLLFEFPYRQVFYGANGVLPSSYLPQMMPSWMAEFYLRRLERSRTDRNLHCRHCVCDLARKWLLAAHGSRLSFRGHHAVDRSQYGDGHSRSQLHELACFSHGLPFPKLNIRCPEWFTSVGGRFSRSLTSMPVGPSWVQPRWWHGLALQDFMTNPMTTRAWAFSSLSFAPAWIFILLTYFTLALELSGPVLVFNRRARFWWWSVSASLHVAVAAVFPIAQISLAMLIFHFFLFDRRWFAKC